MGDLMPLFPLNTVLFPGLRLPLHIFEDRYRLLIRDLMEGDGPRRFGVVAIRQGLEVGDDPVLYDVGCVAEVRRVQPLADGRFDIVTTGGPRFRLRDTDDSRPYLQGAVDYLPDELGEAATALAAIVRLEYETYWDLVVAVTDQDASMPELPDDPALLSYLVGATLMTDLPEKQELLCIPDAAARLRRELSLLRRENALIRHHMKDPPELGTVGPFGLN